MIGQILLSADFERVLATPSRSRSAHFAVHHVGSKPSVKEKPRSRRDSTELSTTDAPGFAQPVDDLPELCWWGAVVPKRHARRAVTRSLLKRQIRAVMARHGEALPPGLWLVRLRQPFATRLFPSAASDALRQAAAAELEQLLSRAAGLGAP